MKQADLGLNLTKKRTRKREFLDEMNLVVPRPALVELVSSHARWAPKDARRSWWRPCCAFTACSSGSH
jgi:hypothetical protein